jgi:hypothetical protein
LGLRNDDEDPAIEDGEVATEAAAAATAAAVAVRAGDGEDDAGDGERCFVRVDMLSAANTSSSTPVRE